MKQKIDMKLAINTDRDRTRALTVAAGMTGVISVTMGGEDKNILTVIGNEVDIVALTRSLIKKLGSAAVVSVIPLNNARFDQEQAEASMRYKDLPNYCSNYKYDSQPNYYENYYNYGRPVCYYNSSVPQYYHPPPPPQYYYTCEQPDDSSCSIM